MLSRIDFMSKGCPAPDLFAESAIADYLDDMQTNFSGDILISNVVAKVDEISDGILAWIPMATVRLTARINARRFSQDLSPFGAS